MFTGIIAAVGTIAQLEPRGGDLRLTIDAGELSMDDVKLGDSIACNGCCLTAVELNGQQFAVDVSVESLDLTTIGGWQVGSSINLEKAMQAGDRFGGHMVSGHVDGLGEVVSRHSDARSERFRLRAPAELARYIAPKGSITIDGTSLTVNVVEDAEFEICIIPHTIDNTIIGTYQVGSAVNLEVDLVARYLERLLAERD
ncbi:MAG: riboflavin synthase [Porticoccaceae bacterium]